MSLILAYLSSGFQYIILVLSEENSRVQSPESKRSRKGKIWTAARSARSRRFPFGIDQSAKSGAYAQIAPQSKLWVNFLIAPGPHVAR